MPAPPAADGADRAFPHSLIVFLPLPSPRIAATVQRALSVDKELSPLVQRAFAVDASSLTIRYKATTARMLRVSANGMFESLGTVLRVCEELDVDVLEAGAKDAVGDGDGGDGGAGA